MASVVPSTPPARRRLIRIVRPTSMHPRYQDWINYLFDHPVADPAWHWDIDAPSLIADEPEIAELIELPFRNSATDLKRFTDVQLSQGLASAQIIGTTVQQVHISHNFRLILSDLMLLM